jgi:recombination protein RecR
MHFSSILIEKGVEAFSSLPGIGKKTALRLVLHLLKQDKEFTERFSEALYKMCREIRTCERCHNLSDDPICRICTDQRRDQGLVCVVENIRDLMAIEDTGQFRGVYHVLGGVISPIDGIGPDELTIDSLVDRCERGDVKEAIMAISPTIEGETTVFYLAKKIKPLGVQVSSIARGVAFGGDLEYADEITLGRSIIARTPYGE